MSDAPAKEQEVKPTESQPESKAPEQSSLSSDEKPVETSAPAAEGKPSAPVEHDGKASIESSAAKAEDKSFEAPKEDAKASEASKPEKPAEESDQMEPKSTQPSVSNGKPPEQTAQNGVKEQTSDGAPQAHQTAADSSTEKNPDAAPAANGTVDSHARDDDVPSSILEKGIIYFFFRPRVNVTDPSDVTDIARSYLILRPLPHGAALADGSIPDAHNSRLLALPKKVLPTSGKDKFMVFVEKAQASFSELKSDFMSASDYATKTQGTSHSPPVTPLAEGVYAITTTGRESHLAYMITIPASLGEVQRDIGLKESGAFVVSAKNPKYPGPANADLGKNPGFSEKIMDDFRDLRWMPLKPEVLDYANAQVLLIGEDAEKALEGLPRDEREGKDGVKEEMERLEGEDEVRVRHLKGKSFGVRLMAVDCANRDITGDDAVFEDLGISKSDYPQVPSTW